MIIRAGFVNDALSAAAAYVSMSPISAGDLSQATADLVFRVPLALVGRGHRFPARAPPDAAEPLACAGR